jgi:hypothetical protein
VLLRGAARGVWRVDAVAVDSRVRMSGVFILMI